MERFFGNKVTTVTTIMILALVTYIVLTGCSRENIGHTPVESIEAVMEAAGLR